MTPEIEQDLRALRTRALARASIDTTFSMPWQYEARRVLSPLAGHCQSMAYLICKRYGGHVVYGFTRGEDRQCHYWNRLADGTEIDLTSDQFEGGDGWHPHPDIEPFALVLAGGLRWLGRHHNIKQWVKIMNAAEVVV